MQLLCAILTLALIGALWKIGTQRTEIQALRKPTLAPEQLHTLTVALMGIAVANPEQPLYWELANKYREELDAKRSS